jgi:ubiquitin C-terminal hydrolase
VSEFAKVSHRLSPLKNAAQMEVFLQALLDALDQEASPSLAAHLWTGKTRTRMRCTRCGAETDAVEAFTDLDLALPDSPSPQLSVQTLLHSSLLQCETLSGDNKFHCGRCGDFVDGQASVSNRLLLSSDKGLDYSGAWRWSKCHLTS